MLLSTNGGSRGLVWMKGQNYMPQVARHFRWLAAFVSARAAADRSRQRAGLGRLHPILTTTNYVDHYYRPTARLTSR